MPSKIEQACSDKGMKMTEHRRVIARVISDSNDHPDVEEVYNRSAEIDPKISLATVYRTVRLFEDEDIVEIDHPKYKSFIVEDPDGHALELFVDKYEW